MGNAATISLRQGAGCVLDHPVRSCRRLSGVLNSDRAIHVNIEIMHAFVRLRQLLSSNKDLARKLEDLEKRYDIQLKVVFGAIKQLMSPPPLPPKRRIGF